MPAKMYTLGDDGFLRVELGARSAAEPVVQDAITIAKRLSSGGRSRLRGRHE